jgi:hypothetical protein
MNIRLQKYKVNRIKGMNQYNAARAAGYSEATSAHHQDRLEKVVNGGIVNALEQAGVTATYRAAELMKLTQATKTVSAIITGKDAGAADTDFIDVPDNPTRLNAHKHIADLMGDVKDKLELSGQLKIMKMDTIVKGNRLLEYSIGQTDTA